MRDKLNIFRGQKASAPSPDNPSISNRPGASNHPRSSDQVAPDAKRIDADPLILDKAQVLYLIEVNSMPGLKLSTWFVTERMIDPPKEWINNLTNGWNIIEHDLHGRSVSLHSVRAPLKDGPLDDLEETAEELTSADQPLIFGQLVFRFVRALWRSYLLKAETTSELIPPDEVYIIGIKRMYRSDGAEVWYPEIEQQFKHQVATDTG